VRDVRGGSVVDDEEVAVDDPVRTAIVTNTIDRVAARIVDLDPRWQSASELYGLRVRPRRVRAGGSGAEMKGVPASGRSCRLCAIRLVR
jgi:hypothetical protein